MATTTIKIADDANPPPNSIQAGESSATSSLGPDRVGGIYRARRSISRPPTFSRRNSAVSNNNNNDGDGEDGSDWIRDDGRKKQVFKGTTLLWLAYQSTGVIYGDIGTSPLYVYSGVFTSTPSYDDLLQVLSLIIWSITIMVTVKYVIIVLRADNEDRDPREAQLVRMERHKTTDMHVPNRTLRAGIEKSKFTRGLLKVIGVLAVSMVLADGVLTPAQSVLGAVQGLNVVSDSITDSIVVGTSCGIIVVLFLLQPFGTGRLASTFAPIVIVWLGFNAGFGIYNLVNYDHSVLKAFSPYYAIRFFIDKKTEGWRMLGGVLLAFTGVEALFADLGAFSMRAIQLSWLCYAYPALLLGYIGQAAFISVNPEAYTNPFYNSVPPGMLYPSLIVAVLAAIVASQAIITATFQLISQIMKLSYCPQVKVVHTSKTFHGQLYVPFLNWTLMAGALLVTGVYSNTTRLGNAYGVCVMFVTFFDTCMVTLVALIVWRLSPILVFLPWLFFATFDGLYLSSALNKVPDGAWFTLMVSAILACVFLLWRFGKENQWRAEAEDRFRPSHLVTKDLQGRLKLTERWGGDLLSRIKGLGIYFDKTGVLTPTVFTQFVSKFGAMPEVIIFFHLHPVEAPSVALEDRYSISRLGSIPGCYRLVVRHGYMDEVISPDLAALIYEQLRKFIISRAGRHQAVPGDEEEDWAEATTTAIERKVSQESQVYETTETTTTVDNDSNIRGRRRNEEEREADSYGHPEGVDSADEKGKTLEPVEIRDAAVRAELATLDRAYVSKIMYVVGKEQMRIRAGTSLFRRGVLGTFLWIRENTRAKIANLRLSMDRVVEVGFVKEI